MLGYWSNIVTSTWGPRDRSLGMCAKLRCQHCSNERELSFFCVISLITASNLVEVLEDISSSFMSFYSIIWLAGDFFFKVQQHSLHSTISKCVFFFFPVHVVSKFVFILRGLLMVVVVDKHSIESALTHKCRFYWFFFFFFLHFHFSRPISSLADNCFIIHLLVHGWFQGSGNPALWAHSLMLSVCCFTMLHVSSHFLWKRWRLHWLER